MLFLSAHASSGLGFGTRIRQALHMKLSYKQELASCAVSGNTARLAEILRVIDHTGKTRAIDLAIDNGHLDLAMMILESYHKPWEFEEAAGTCLVKVIRGSLRLPVTTRELMITRLRPLVVSAEYQKKALKAAMFVQDSQNVQEFIDAGYFSRSVEEIVFEELNVPREVEDSSGYDRVVLNTECEFHREGDTVILDGQGAWVRISACLEDPTVIASPFLHITNTGPFAPISAMFAMDGFQTKHLYMTNIPNLLHIPPDFFIGFRNLTLLSLPGLGIERVYIDSFYGLDKLTILYSSTNMYIY